MILNDTEVTERMSSPLNLHNRLKALSSNNKSKSPIVSIPPSASEVIDNLEEKLNYGSIKSKASGIMIAAMDELKARIPEASKPEQLARIAESMSKIVNAENENRKDNDLNRPQFILYAPQFNNENHYETIFARDNI